MTPPVPGSFPSATPRPPVGVGFTAYAPIPLELDFPIPPKRVWDNGHVRFKVLVEARYEVVADASGTVTQTTSLKVDPRKRKASLQFDLKAKLSSQMEAAVALKLKTDTFECINEFMKDRRKFALALLRYVDVVVGAAIPVPSNYMKFVGVGLTLDTDFCFFSILLPFVLPYTHKEGFVTVGGRISGNVVIKFGPGKTVWAAILKKFGMKRAVSWMLRTASSMNRLLPSEIAKLAAEEVVSEANLTAIETGLSAWLGIALTAVEISEKLLQFSLYVCHSARASGERDGDINLAVAAYVRRIYGMDIPSAPLEHGQAIVKAAVAQADKDIEEFGALAMQEYLEDRFNNGSPASDENGRVTHQDQVLGMISRFWLDVRSRAA